MSSVNYKSIKPPIEVYTELVPIPEKHLELSTRGVIIYSERAYEVGNCLKISLKIVSMTGSEDFTGKVFETTPQEDGSFELHVNFYGVPHSRENEIYDFIENQG